MDFLNAVLAMAPSPAGTQQDPRAATLNMLMLMLFMGVVFYFLILRPQRVRTKQQEALLKNLKSNDRIVTASGIVGVVISVKEKSLTIRSADAKLEILKSAVTEVTEKPEKTGESSSSNS